METLSKEQIAIEEKRVQDDTKHRRNLKEIFNKKEHDFPTLDDFKDYEEAVELLIYNLVHGIDIEKTNQIIEDYKKKNVKSIADNMSSHDYQLEFEKKIVKEEKERYNRSMEEYQNQLKDEKKQRDEDHRRQNQALLGESDRNTGNMKFSSSSSSTSANGTANTAPPIRNPVMELIYSRPLPEINTNAVPAVKPEGNEYMRRVYEAGGYVHANYNLRNWSEIRSQLDVTIDV